MIEWWNELILLKQIFYTIAIPATVILIIQAIFSMLGLSDMDGEMDGMDGIGSEGFDGLGESGEIFEVDLDEADAVSDGFVGDFRFFTFRGLIAFFSIFGWTGAILANTRSGFIAVTGATIAGLVAMFVVGYLFYVMTKLQSSGNISYVNTIGKTGEVYLTIPPNNQGKGKVMLTVQERLIECSAMTKGDAPIKTGETIKVIGLLSDHTLIVERT
jgi:hypothetical protein